MASVLTDAVVKRVKGDPIARREIPDGLLPGLYLIVQAQPADGREPRKSWAVRYRAHGKTRKLTLGAFPAFGLSEAREQARAALQSVQRGDDPALDKALAKERARSGDGTFEAVARQFLAEYAKPKNKTWIDTASTFGLKPDKTRSGPSDDPAEFVAVKDGLVCRFGHRPVESITRDEIKSLLRNAAKGTAVAANRLLAALRKFFNWCIAEGYVTDNPCAKLAKPQEEISRSRWLKSDDEFRAVWLAVQELGWPFTPIYQLLILTGARREEVAAMRWRELDFSMKEWTIPGERTKNGEEHVLPLSDTALEVLQGLKRAGRSDLVFSVTGSTPPSGWSKVKRRLDQRALIHLRTIATARGGNPEDAVIAPWKTHDLRRTLASRMGDLDVMPHVVEAILNHVSGFRAGVAGTYNRNKYQRAMRAALEAWSQEVRRLAEGEAAPSNVISLAGRSA